MLRGAALCSWRGELADDLRVRIREKLLDGGGVLFRLCRGLYRNARATNRVVRRLLGRPGGGGLGAFLGNGGT